MTKIHTLHARVTDGHLRKLHGMQRATGLNPSQLVRLLIDQAEVKTRPVVNVQLEANSRDTQLSRAGVTAVQA